MTDIHEVRAHTFNFYQNSATQALTHILIVLNYVPVVCLLITVVLLICCFAGEVSYHFKVVCPGIGCLDPAKTLVLTRLRTHMLTLHAKKVFTASLIVQIKFHSCGEKSPQL